MRPNSQPPLSKLKPNWLEADGVRCVKQNIAQCLQNEWLGQKKVGKNQAWVWINDVLEQQHWQSKHCTLF